MTGPSAADAAVRPPARALLLLPLVCAGFGLLGAVVIALLGGYGDQSAAEATPLGLALGAVGLVTGVIGALGATLALVARRRRGGGAASRAGSGAGLAILVAWWAYAGFFLLTAENYAILGVLVAAVGLVAAVIGGVVAGLLVAVAGRRRTARARRVG